MLDPGVAVATLVLDHAECAPIFVRHHIDYCCKGQRPLTDACRDLGLDLPTIVAELESAIDRETATESALDPRTLSTRDLIANVITPHHQYLHRTLPFLQTLAAKVALVHGNREPALREVAYLVDQLVETFGRHLAEEEVVLFPALLEGRVEDVGVLLGDMRCDHDEVGVMLARLRTAAADFIPPAWACNSYRTLLRELYVLEADTLVHVHIENHVLLPRYMPSA